MAIYSFMINGTLTDAISSRLARINAALKGTAAAANAANRSMARGSSIADGLRMWGMQAAAINSNTSALRRFGNAARQSRAAQGLNWFLAGGGNGRGGVPPRRRGRAWGPFQQGLAATGGYGYALGRGGLATAGTIGGGMLAYSGLKKFASFEGELTNLAKAANMSRAEMFEFGKGFQGLAKQYGLGQDDVAGMGAKVALGGVAKNAVMGVTESAAKAMLLWDDVDPGEVSNVLARTASKWYKGKDPGQIRGLMDQFIGAVDFFEDRYPTSAKDILKGYHRFMSTAKLAGMTPEQAVAQIATMTTLGEPSGERAGTRLGTNWDRIGGVMTGAIKKKGMSLKGIDSKGLTEELNTNGQMAVFKFLDQAIERNVPKYIAELTKKGMKPEEAKKEARKRASRDAKGFISKALGYESAKNLNPLIAEYHEALLQTAVTNKDLAAWAIKNPGFIEYLKSLGEVGEQLLKDLEAFTKTPPSVTTMTGGQMGTNINLMQQKLESKAKQLQASWDRWLTAIGSDLAPEAIAAMDSLGATLDANSEGVEKRGTVLGNALRSGRLRGAMAGTNQNSIMTPWLPAGGTNSVPIIAPNGQAFDAAGNPIQGNILRSDDNSQRWAKGDGETRDQIDKYFPPETWSEFFARRAREFGGASTAPNSFVGGLVGQGGTAAPGFTGGLVGPQVVPGVPQTITVPFSVSVSQPGQIKVNVDISGMPAVTVQGSGANNTAGAQADSPSGVAAPPGK
jgi:TP901 family phage tail tape measure protein